MTQTGGNALLIPARPTGLLLGALALCVIGLFYGCSQKTEESSEQAGSEVALKPTRIVYYAIPG